MKYHLNFFESIRLSQSFKGFFFAVIACALFFFSIINSFAQVYKNQILVGGLLNGSKDVNYVFFSEPLKPMNSYTNTTKSWKINSDVLVAYGITNRLHFGIGFQSSFQRDKVKTESNFSTVESTPKTAQSFSLGPLIRYYIINNRFGVFAQLQNLWGKQSTSQDFMYFGSDLRKGKINIFQAGIGGYYSINKKINVELMINYKNKVANISREIDENSSIRILNINDQTEQVLINVGTIFLINRHVIK